MAAMVLELKSSVTIQSSLDGGEIEDCSSFAQKKGGMTTPAELGIFQIFDTSSCAISVLKNDFLPLTSEGKQTSMIKQQTNTYGKFQELKILVVGLFSL